MSIQWKSTLIIIATLVIGILIGIFLAGPVMYHHIRPDVEKRSAKMFTPILERIIRPTPEQEDAVREILDRYSVRLDGLHDDFRSEMIDTMDSLRLELEPILTVEQKARLEERHSHLKHLMKRGRGPRGSGRERPPGGPVGPGHEPSPGEPGEPRPEAPPVEQGE
jgi:hypothetical protein